MLETLDKRFAEATKMQNEFIKNFTEQMKHWRRARSDMQLYFAELKRRDTLKEEYVVLANAIETLIDILNVNLRIETISNPDYEEKLNKKQVSLISVRTQLVNQITSKLQAVRGKVGQPLIKGEAGGLNLAKYKLQKSLIEPAKLKEALIKAVDEKYLRPALRAYNIPHGGVNYLGLNLETQAAFVAPGQHTAFGENGKQGQSVSTARPSGRHRDTRKNSEAPTKRTGDEDDSDAVVLIESQGCSRKPSGFDLGSSPSASDNDDEVSMALRPTNIETKAVINIEEDEK